MKFCLKTFTLSSKSSGIHFSFPLSYQSRNVALTHYSGSVPQYRGAWKKYIYQFLRTEFKMLRENSIGKWNSIGHGFPLRVLFSEDEYGQKLINRLSTSMALSNQRALMSETLWLFWQQLYNMPHDLGHYVAIYKWQYLISQPQNTLQELTALSS